MCNIWNAEVHKEMAPSEYSKLPTTLRTLNISGGEPFLHPDLDEVVRVIHRRLPRARLVFSTNGLLTEDVVAAIDRYKAFHESIGVGVSVDCLRDSHERIRGVEGIFDKARSTIEGLREIGISDLRIGMTILPENASDVLEVYRLAKELGVEFTATFAHNSDVYFKKTDNVQCSPESDSLQSVSSVVRCQLKSVSPKDWLRAFHTEGIIDERIRQSFRGECLAGRRYFFLSPYGDVFPCSVMDLKLGNITDVADWNELMTKEVVARTAGIVKGCGLDCWMVCNTRSLIISHPVRSALWVITNKLKKGANTS
ncbi:MAG: radical SAM protein [Methanobacteriota archaeon]|nr:MAG: radical SAM protein [Euryarchaeota archaeon]